MCPLCVLNKYAFLSCTSCMFVTVILVVLLHFLFVLANMWIVFNASKLNIRSLVLVFYTKHQYCLSLDLQISHVHT